MDPYFYEFHQELVVSNPVSIIKATPSKTSRRDQITFNFSCKHKHHRWITTQDSTESHLLEDLESPAVMKSMTYNVPKINKRREFLLRAAVFKGLEDFPLSFSERQDLSQVALNTAWDILVKSCPRHHHHLRLDFDLMVVHDYAIDESRYIDWTSQEAMEAAMVPATDASIESLRSKTIEYSNHENHGSCVVCLEEFDDGCDNIVVTMPCSHIFHGECIKKWLRRCHRCPVCRYEMPTD